MNNHRYAPPVAEVDDIADNARSPRPTQVVWAVRLLWATTLLSIPEFYFEAVRARSIGAMVTGFAIEAVMTAFACYLYVSIYRGKNWARIVTLIFTVLSTAMVIFGPALPNRSGYEQLLTWLNTVSDVVCMGLLFTSARAHAAGQYRSVTLVRFGAVQLR